MYLIIRADGNGDIGMGHLMRCSAIADEFEKAGGKTCFLVSQDSDLSAVKSLGHSAYQLKKIGNMGWDVDEAIDWIRSQHADRLLIDSYRVDAKYLKKLNKIIDTYYMDDLYAFDYPVDHIINHNIEASMERYKNQTYVKDYYLGVQYLPVRKQILAARKRGVAHEIKKALVTTGATDPYEIELKLLEEVAPAYPQIRFTFLLGTFYSKGYINKLIELSQTHNNIIVLGWTKDMGQLYAENDLTIGPGSTSLLESMTVGTAAISFSFVDNHLNECLTLDEMHIAPYCGDVRDNMQKVLQKITEDIAQLNNRGRLEDAAARYRMLFDGHGAERTAEVLMNGSSITEENAEKPLIREKIKSSSGTVRETVRKLGTEIPPHN